MHFTSIILRVILIQLHVAYNSGIVPERNKKEAKKEGGLSTTVSLRPSLHRPLSKMYIVLQAYILDKKGFAFPGL